MSEKELKKGLVCLKCGGRLELRNHKTVTAKMLRQPYYFRGWLKCTSCGYIKHFENQKVYNYAK